MEGWGFYPLVSVCHGFMLSWAEATVAPPQGTVLFVGGGMVPLKAGKLTRNRWRGPFVPFTGVSSLSGRWQSVSFCDCCRECVWQGEGCTGKDPLAVRGRGSGVGKCVAAGRRVPSHIQFSYARGI